MKKPDRGPKFREKIGKVTLREIKRNDLVKDPYRVRCHYPKEDGRTGTREFLNWREARAEAEKINQVIEDQLTVGTNEMQFGRVWREWFKDREEDCARGEIKKATLANLRIRGGHAVAEFERVKIKNLKTYDVERWGKRLAGKYSHGFARACVAHVRWALDHAVRKRYLLFNPLRQGDPVKLKGKPSARPWVPSWEMMDRLIEFGKGPRYRGHSRIMWSNMKVGIALSAGASLRLGELLALEWKHIDFAARRIQVRQSFSWHDGIGDPKTPSSIRNVPMNQWTYESLLDHKYVLESCGAPRRNPRVRANTSTTEGFVIRHRSRDCTVSQVSYSKSFRRFAYAAGIREARDGRLDFRWHALRRFYMSASLAMGQSLMEVGEHVGHRDPSLTAKIYARALEDPPAIWRHRFSEADPLAPIIIDGVVADGMTLIAPPAHHEIKPDAPAVPDWVHEAIRKLQGGWRLRDVVSGICHGRTTLNFHLRKLGLPAGAPDLSRRAGCAVRAARGRRAFGDGHCAHDRDVAVVGPGVADGQGGGVPNTGKYLKNLKKSPRPRRPVATDTQQIPLPLFEIQVRSST